MLDSFRNYFLECRKLKYEKLFYIERRKKLRIPINEIFPNPDIPKSEKRENSKPNNKFKKNPVVLATKNGYVLLKNVLLDLTFFNHDELNISRNIIYNTTYIL